MPRLPLALLALFLTLGSSQAAGMAGHCAPFTVAPVPGDPGAFKITTARGSTVARRAAPARPAAGVPVAEFRVFPNSFDADGDTLGTQHDTILVAPGTIVRWVRRGPGFHTVTNGADSGDLNAASEYNAIFDDLTTSFEHVFITAGLHDFFCFIHEPVMEGSVFVTAATAGVAPGVIQRARFTRLPSPNPSRGELGFAVALPHAVRVSIAVLDVSGRRVALVQDAPLPAGEHSFRWDGRASDGRLVQSGRYFVRLDAGDVTETRPVSLVR